MSRITNTEQWKNAMTVLHNGKYNYDKSVYVDRKTDIIITCPIHGDFSQKPAKHAMGRGCRKCANNSPLTKEEFVQRATEVHGNKYDYSEVNITNTITKVCIICPEHGEFWQTPAGHYRASGCSKCCGAIVTNTEEFIKRAKEVHGDEYSYSKSDFTGINNKIEIICKEHGSFFQTVSNHISGHRCKKCSGNYMDNEMFVKKSKLIHGNRYNYDKTQYEKSNRKVVIFCNTHGEFKITPNNHLNGQGCQHCANESVGNKLSKPLSNFLEEVKVVHGDKYKYNTSNYKNRKSTIKAYCEKHGWFKIKASNLLRGNGCKECYLKSKMGENNHNWNPDLTNEERLEKRDLTENINWRKSVFERDDYTCAICGKKGNKLNAHHLNGYHWDKENRFNIDNGISLCVENDRCHIEFHKIYGNKNNTKEQFEEFYKMKTGKDFIIPESQSTTKSA